ncbi:hypothetical protein Poly21_14070 [Allorhodopirellula heiligendammensis]|uniref:Uncharacterized protein n=1 Tax=Allorhodopirellula heiligendammensis TaxID=2714739 RepID=A0A5C6C564_9BACT|nr:hypothetical protein [Allorhodopirellula heiligendammensis]TWU19235.1 hypothetical protein Poly21_14070 [Allorhodopirellula heiligendammensis]
MKVTKKCFRWQRYVPIFGSLATVNVNHHAFAINITDLQVPGLVESEAHRVDGPVEQGNTFDTTRVDDGVDLINSENLGEGPGLL